MGDYGGMFTEDRTVNVQKALVSKMTGNEGTLIEYSHE